VLILVAKIGGYLMITNGGRPSIVEIVLKHGDFLRKFYKGENDENI